MTIELPNKYKFLPRFSQLAIASVLSNIMVPLAGLVDIAFLGHLADIRHLAGVILATILFDYLYRIFKLLRTSTNAITAQAVGLDDRKAILLAGLRSGAIALGIGLVILLLQYPLQKIGFFILSGSPEIEASGISYFNARIWGAPAVLLNFVLVGWFLGREMNAVVILLSLVGNGSNILLDYLTIVKWGWESMGAGLATALSQYLALFIGLIGFALAVRKQQVPTLKEIFDWKVLKGIIAFKGNILVRFLCLISAYAIFTNLSAVMGTTVLAQNGLILQIAILSQFTIQGIGMTTQTLTGNFKGKGNIEQMKPLLTVSIMTSLMIALAFAIVSILFPQTVFGLLTNHANINENIDSYIVWLLPLQGFTAIAFMLEGYFIGLKEGVTLRNAVLIAFGLGFIPLITLGWYLHSNHILWASLVSYMATLMAILGVQIPRTLGSQTLPSQEAVSNF